MMMWQPIETAPRNQTFLAVLDCAGEQTICTMRWSVVEAKNSRPDSKTFHVERVTHWMPLPELPGAQAQPAPSEQDESVRKSWARFSNELHRSPDAPYPGMSEAFEQHFSQSFTDRDWRAESGTWAAAWKAAKHHDAQPAPSFSDAYQGAMEEVAIWKKRALEAEDVNRKFITDINGPTHMGEPVQNEPISPVLLTKRLKPVIYWLRNGCDPMRAADELELLIAAAPEAKP